MELLGEKAHKISSARQSNNITPIHGHPDPEMIMISSCRPRSSSMKPISDLAAKALAIPLETLILLIIHNCSNA
jgi:hypothetical protein